MQAKKTKLVGILKKIINGYSSAYIAIEKIINILHWTGWDWIYELQRLEADCLHNVYSTKGGGMFD